MENCLVDDAGNTVHEGDTIIYTGCKKVLYTAEVTAIKVASDGYKKVYTKHSRTGLKQGQFFKLVREPSKW